MKTIANDFTKEDIAKFIQLKAEGKTRNEIKEIMNLKTDYSEQKLRRHILRKLDCKNINEAIVKAYKLSLINLPKQN